MAGTFNASEITLDLATASTPTRGRVELTANASDVRLLLPERQRRRQRDTERLIAAGLRAGGRGAARRAGSGILSSDDLAGSGLEEGNPGLWTTPDFSVAGDHVNLSLSSTVSSFTLERPESCS